jgi:hypothetical protein
VTRQQLVKIAEATGSSLFDKQALIFGQLLWQIVIKPQMDEYCSVLQKAGVAHIGPTISRGIEALLTTIHDDGQMIQETGDDA